jgi:predicted enzyme related to lactoylglutathione lyase
MTTRPINVVFDAADPARLARFWSDALGWTITVDDPDEVAVERPGDAEWGDGGSPCLTFLPVADAKVGKNRVHLDLVSDSPQDQRDTVARLLALGATHVDIGQGAVPWVVLADPEGNELCVLEPREDYAGVHDVASVVLDCSDPADLAGFWSAATGWPATRSAPGVVSLRHPTAPTTWLELIAVPEPKPAKNRLHVDVAPPAGEDLGEEVARLEAAGARRTDIGQGEVTWVVLADPEGNELCVLTPR